MEASENRETLCFRAILRDEVGLTLGKTILLLKMMIQS
jgi:hypothetical protein